jgi:hypothetical protein
MYATKSPQDLGRWDILRCSINNIRYTVPIAVSIKVTAADMANLPGIAARYLNSRFLWYTILHYNGLYDSVEDVKLGMTLHIPKLEPLLAALKTQSKDNVSGITNLIVI